MGTNPIGLKELIFRVKQELMSPSPDDPVPMFYIDELELELSFVVRREGEAGLKLYVVDVGGSSGEERVQTVRVRLSPLYSREELRQQIEQDPQMRERVDQLARETLLKRIKFPE